MKLTKTKIRKILADLYKEACIDENCDMREIVDVFEILTETFLTQNTLIAWTKIKLDEKRFGHTPYFELIRSYRNQIWSSYSQIAISEIHHLVDQNPKLGFDKWIEVFTDALVTFESEVISPLFREKFLFDKVSLQKTEAYAKCYRLVMDNKWAESISFFIELAENEQLPTWKRCYFSIYVAEIFLYHYGYVDKAQDWQLKTKQIDDDHFLVERLQGEIELQNKSLIKARNHFLNAIAMESNHVNTYLFMGETFLEEDFAIAKQWYLDAIGINFLDASPYKNLLKLFGTANWIDENPAEFASYIANMEKVEQRNVSNKDLYNGYREVAFSYSLQGKVEESNKYYLKAIDLLPDLTSAKIDLGYMLSSKEKFDEAEKYFLEALKQPDSHPYEGNWALGGLAEQKGDLKLAIFYYQKCIGLRPFGDDRVYNVLGLQYYKLENYVQAMEEFSKAIASYPFHTVYFDNLKDAAEKSGNPEKLGIYHDLLTQHFPQNHLYLNNAGVYYFNSGNFDNAISLYTKAISIEPTIALYYKNRALAFQKTFQYTKSEADYLYALALEKEPSYLKTLELSKNEYQKALVLGRDSDLLNSIGLVMYNQDKYEEAIKYYTQAIQLDDQKLVYIENRAIAKEKLELYTEAIEDYKKGLEFGDDPFLFNAIGRIEFWQNNYEVAIECYSNALTLAPEVQVYWINRAMAYQDLGDLDKAENDYLSALILGQNIYCFNSLGLIKTLKNDQTSAVEYYNKALDLDSNQAILFENRGISYEKMGLYDNAEIDLINALELEPNAYRYNFLGLIYYRKGDNKKAITYYTEAILSNPEESIYLENRGLAYFVTNNYELAEKDFHAVVEIQPTSNSLNYLAIIYFRWEAYEKSIDYYSQAIELEPNQAILWENRGLAWENLQNYQKAEEDILQALKLEPTPIRLNFLGLIKYKCSDFKAAIDYYSKAIEMDSLNPIYRENRALAYEHLGNYQEAMLDYEFCLSTNPEPYLRNKLGEIQIILGNLKKAQ